MHLVTAWRFIFLLNLSSFIYCQNCNWLHLLQMGREILIQIGSVKKSPEDCIHYTMHLPNIDTVYNISQEEAAAFAMREVAKQTKWLYRRHHMLLRWPLGAWNRLQELLHLQSNQLSACIQEASEYPKLKESISEQFIKLEDIYLQQKNTGCALNVIHTEIMRNLRLAALLSIRMRRQQLLKHFNAP